MISYIDWIDGKEILEHVIFDEEGDASFSRKTPTECIRMSVKLHRIKRILPGNYPIEELFELGPPAKRTSTKKRSDGYVSPKVAISWSSR